MRTMRAAVKNERGAALLEAAVTIPILLLIAVGIFEFGRAYQTWQILTNAAREGARVAVIPGATAASVETRVRDCMTWGQLANADTATVTVNRNASVVVNGNPVSASEVTIGYPFQFAVLRPVARLVDPNSNQPGNVTMGASAVMRNEAGS